MCIRDRDNPKYHVVYHEKVDYIAPLRQDIEYINEESPLYGEYRLNLSIQQVEGLSVSDFQFIDRLKKLCDDLLPKDFENNDGFMDALYAVSYTHLNLIQVNKILPLVCKSNCKFKAIFSDCI